MSDRELWLTVRRALLMICKAIERKYPIKDMELESGKQITVSYLVDDLPENDDRRIRDPLGN